MAKSDNSGIKAKYPDIEALKKDIEATFKRILNNKSLIRPCFAGSNSQAIDIDRDFIEAFMKEDPPKEVIVSQEGKGHMVIIFGTDVSFKNAINLRFAIHSVPYIVAVSCK